MVRTADAKWNGDLKGGSGTMRLGSGAFEGSYSFKSRMEDGTGTNPEELIGAAHAGCFSMAFAATLAGAGFQPETVATNAKVHFGPVEGGFAISKVELTTEATVPGIDAAKFAELAEQAKSGCPVSKALAGVEITLNAKLV
ncbi:MAG TPA: OsmC family protein [Armatimonadaceae bacterium]|nr:OsmC family protein [Armatimonadaceae bacterium]